MGTFNDFLENAKAVAFKVGEKVSDTYDIAKLKTLKARVERDLSKQYEVLGEKCYCSFKEDNLSTVDFSENIEKIDDLLQHRSDILKRIEDLKNLKRCAVCGAPQKADNSHCSECGSKL